MENKNARFNWKSKNSSLVFGLSLAGVAALSVLFAMGQVRQAERERQQTELQNEAAVEDVARNNDTPFTSQVDEAIRNALEQEDDGDIGVQELPGEISTAVSSSEISAEAETEEEGDDGLAAETESSVAASSAEILPTVAFEEADSLSWPVAGSVVLDYSMDKSIYFPTLQQYKYNPALVIGSDVGAQVVAAAKGIVENITNDAETGTTIVMNLGNGYKLKYGQLKDVAVAEGAVIEQGGLLGYVSDPTKYYCVEGSNLYFAMTRDELPVDPVLYLE